MHHCNIINEQILWGGGTNRSLSPQTPPLGAFDFEPLARSAFPFLFIYAPNTAFVMHSPSISRRKHFSDSPCVHPCSEWWCVL